MIRFIHIPKNAGTSTIQWLEKNNVNFIMGDEKPNGGLVGTHRLARWFKTRLIEDKIFYIAIKRNPYSRLVSYYNYGRKKFNDHQYSFKEFVIHKKEPEYNIPSPWQLQIEWMIDEENNFLIDHLFSYESLETDLQNFFKIKKKLPHLNASTGRKYEEYYTPRLKNIVYDHFKKDFEMLGY